MSKLFFGDRVAVLNDMFYEYRRSTSTSLHKTSRGQHTRNSRTIKDVLCITRWHGIPPMHTWSKVILFIVHLGVIGL
jgi:hypothetical protein